MTVKIRKLNLTACSLFWALISPITAQAKEKIASIAYDQYTKSENISGEIHWHNALLDLDKWYYFLSASISNGVPKNPVLMFSTFTPEWYFFDRAADIDGNDLPVIQGSREVEVGNVHEVVGIQMSPKYLADHRSTGFNLKIMGSKGARVLVVPPEVVSTFETTYLAEVAKFGGFRNDLAATDASIHPTPSQIGQAASKGAEVAAARGGFGIVFATIPQGALLVAVAPGSRAERGKLKAGQLVTAIDGKSVAGMPQVEVVAILRASTGVTTFTVAGLGDLAVTP